jgi:hypothetical protein
MILHQTYKKNSSATKRIVATLSTYVFQGHGEVDRKRGTAGGWEGKSRNKTQQITISYIQK